MAFKLGGIWLILLPSWGLWGSFWLQLEGLGVLLGHLGSKLGVMGPSWLSWSHLGPHAGGSWAHFGSKLGDLGSKLRVLGDILGSCWGYVGAMLEHLGAVLQHLTSTCVVKALILKKCQKCNTYHTFGTSERAQRVQVGAKLEHLGAMLAPSWGSEGSCWLSFGSLEVMLSHLGSKLGSWRPTWALRRILLGVQNLSRRPELHCESIVEGTSGKQFYGSL